MKNPVITERIRSSHRPSKSIDTDRLAFTKAHQYLEQFQTVKSRMQSNLNFKGLHYIQKGKDNKTNHILTLHYVEPMLVK